MLCAYRNLFGRVAEGAHSYRIFDIAIVDVLFTVLGAYLLHRLFSVSFGVMVVGLMGFILLAGTARLLPARAQRALVFASAVILAALGVYQLIVSVHPIGAA